MSETCVRASNASVPLLPRAVRKSAAHSEGTAPRGATTRSGTTNSKASTVAAALPLSFPRRLRRGDSKSRSQKGAKSGSGMETMAWEARGEEERAFFLRERKQRVER